MVMLYDNFQSYMGVAARDLHVEASQKGSEGRPQQIPELAVHVLLARAAALLLDEHHVARLPPGDPAS